MNDCLSQRVLVLNRLWQAVNIVGARRAFAILFQDHARVLHAEEGDFQVLNPWEWVEYSMAHPTPNGHKVHTVTFAIKVPKILLLNHYDRLPMKEVKFTRQNLFERDRYTCQYCGGRYSHRGLNLDHVIPRERGGKTTWENIVTSCLHCNTRKANRLPHEAGMKLRRKPFRPQFRPFINFVIGADIDASWVNFLNLSSASR